MRVSGLIATCSIVLLCAMNINSFLEIQSTDKITTAIQEQDSTNQTVTNNYTNNYNETHNHYESNNDEEIAAIQNDINEIKEEQQRQETYSNNTNTSSTQEPWRGPKSYNSDKAAGYPAICGYCGGRGEIYYDIIEWMDNGMTYHLTHLNCAEAYCNKMNVQPRKDEAYKIRP